MHKWIVGTMVVSLLLCAAQVGLAQETRKGAKISSKPSQVDVTKMARMQVMQILPNLGEATHVVLLKTEEQPPTYLAIWIGEMEAMAIHLRLNRRKPPRPLTHDLIDQILLGLGAKVERVEVEEVRSESFLSKLVLSTNQGKEIILDARPSDSIALALGTGAPIWVANEVLQEAGFTQVDIERERQRKKLEEGLEGDKYEEGIPLRPGGRDKGISL